MKSTAALILSFIFSIHLFSAEKGFTIDTISVTKITSAIENNDYTFFENAFKTKTLNVNQKINGKTLLIYASILDKPEMVNFLIQNGANLKTLCVNGFNAFQYAKKNKSHYALAELIVISA
tara:strand:- start:2066 stop:2428 length:363 start_codon:yes stop_codon:yes gene_type:complete